MKKILLLFAGLFLYNPASAQISFCSAGAEWNYLFTEIIFSNTLRNEKIKYTGDTVIGGTILKKLTHRKFYVFCNDYVTITTFIKQNGDTVFFSNKFTNNNWQILYNFAAQAGQGWQTTIKQETGNMITYGYLVDSVKTLVINGVNLRRLVINNGTTIITERLGNSAFLFNYANSNLGSCDGDYFREAVCYKDDQFGTFQYSQKPCDFQNLTSLSSLSSNDNQFAIFPNPTEDILTIATPTRLKENSQIKLFDVLGKTILNVLPVLETENYKIDLKDIPPGVYLLKIFENSEPISTQKIIKK